MTRRVHSNDPANPPTTPQRAKQARRGLFRGSGRLIDQNSIPPPQIQTGMTHTEQGFQPPRRPGVSSEIAPADDWCLFSRAVDTSNRAGVEAEWLRAAALFKGRNL